MKIPVYTLEGKKKGEITLGKNFSLPIREDIIRRAFLSEASLKRKPYGSDPLAGKRTSAHYHGKRHYRWSMMNREMARMKRIHSQGFLNFTARFVPQATKGRKAHPPKAEKNWGRKINKKERTFALLSSLSATVQKDYLLSRGHTIDSVQIPLILEDKFQELKKTKDVLAVLEKLGLPSSPKKKIRAGKGKARGRKYRKKKGPLIIVKEGSLPAPFGMEVRQVNDLTVSDLAPGGDAGRLCVWTQSSIEEAGKL